MLANSFIRQPTHNNVKGSSRDFAKVGDYFQRGFASDHRVVFVICGVVPPGVMMELTPNGLSPVRWATG